MKTKNAVNLTIVHKNQQKRIIDAMREYLAKHRPIRAELRGTFFAV